MNLRWQILVGIGLVILMVVAFGEVRQHDFTNYDDDRYVTGNPRVQEGITPGSVGWAFTALYRSTWQPLVWLSYMIDHELYGLKPGGYHLTNLILHIVNAVLLLVLLTRATGSLWPGAFVAALFALHPLRVEAVAWVAGRKDVLSTLFWMLAMLAYVSYVRRPSSGRFALVGLWLCLGLMAKPMLVTVPFVLLLLDYWPLRRMKLAWNDGGSEQPLSATARPDGVPHQAGSTPSDATRSIRDLVSEKIPLFVLAGLSSFVTYVAQRGGGAVGAFGDLPLLNRVGNALVSYVRYIGKTVWPTDFVVLYPHPGSWPGLYVAGAGVVLLAVSVIVIRQRRRRYLAVGWFWYLGTLAPVIGVVQIGLQALADRFSYVPLIGLAIMAAWGVPELLQRLPGRRVVLAVAAVTVVAACTLCTRLQVRHWRDSITLFEYTIAHSRDNVLAYNNLGDALVRKERFDEALPHFRKAVEILPRYKDARYNLASVLAVQGQREEALAQLSELLEIDRDYVPGWLRKAAILEEAGRFEEALTCCDELIRINTRIIPAWLLKARILERLGRSSEARACHEQTERIKLGW